MKIRTGFVSNSSSSSFIISIPKDNKPCPTCGHVDDILKFFKSEDEYEETSVDEIGKNNVINNLSDWGLEDEELNKIKKAIENCKNDVALVRCDNNNSTLRDLALSHLVWDLN